MKNLKDRRLILVFPSEDSILAFPSEYSYEDYHCIIVSGDDLSKKIDWLLEEHTALRPEDIQVYSIDGEYKIYPKYDVKKVSEEHAQD